MWKHMRQRRGFTMAECMIAIGILGVGMTMVGVLFPAAVKESKSSSGNIIGKMIAQNALTITRNNRYREDYLMSLAVAPPKTSLSVVSFDYPGDVLENHYPTGVSNTQYGFLVLARNISVSPNICELVIIAYRKQDIENTVSLVKTSVGVNGGATSLSLSNESAQGPNFKVGSCLIADPNNAASPVGIGKVGNWPGGTTVRLEEAPAAGGTSVWTVVENEGSEILPISPVIYTMTSRICFPGKF